MKRRYFLLIPPLLLKASNSFGFKPEEILKDTNAEQRARTLSKEIRCLVCQNQSIDDSNADLASDLRNIIRKMIVNGKTNNEIKEYLVTKYGDFILMKPPINAKTIILWTSPFWLSLFGALIIFSSLRSRPKEKNKSEDLN